jgi:hypothetical protein
VESSGVGSSRIPGAKSQLPSTAASSKRGGFSVPTVATLEKRIASQGGIKQRRLFMHQQYFGLEARAFHAGAERMLERVSAQAPEQLRINVRSLAEDFRLDAAASGTLLRAFLAGGLLYPDGNGGYYVAERFCDYARARVVVPVSRARAKALIGAACQIAARVNADWHRNPFLIETMLVSGAYMSRRDLLTDVSLWLVPRYRPKPRAWHLRPSVGKGDALHQIEEAMTALSSFMLVRMVPDKEDVHRPFCVVFQANEVALESSLPAWETLGRWSASVNQRLVSR